MSRARLIGLFVIIPALLVTAGANAPGGDQPAKQPAAPVGGQNVDPFADCAKACDDCARTCDGCGAHCAKMLAEGHKEHLKTLQTCQDCATLCSAASCVVSRRGPFWDITCTACADACKRCGDACATHAAHDPMMKRCMEECRRCEKACREMLRNATGQPAPKTP